MGDRGGVLIKSNWDWAYLYTHYNASDLILNVKNGLKKLLEDYEYYFNNGSKQSAYIFAEMAKVRTYGLEITPIQDEEIEEILEEENGQQISEEYIKKIISSIQSDLEILIIINMEIIKIFSQYPYKKLIDTTIGEFVKI